MELLDELEGLILSFCASTASRYLLTSKSAQKRRDSLMAWMHLFRTGKALKRNRVAHLSAQMSLRQCRVNDDFHGHRREILEFLANTKKQSHTVQCIHAYHRKLVHDFCDLFGLKHVSRVTRHKKQRVCRWCSRPEGYRIFVDNYGNYGAMCILCHGHTDNWCGIISLIAVESVAQKDVFISK